jgi:hypothetical protein
MNRPTIGITIFEEPLIRTYVSSSNGLFLSKLCEDFNVVIFTAPKLNSIISRKMDEFKIKNIEVCDVLKSKETLANRLFTSPLRWSLNSSTVYLKIKRKHKTNLNFAYLCHRLLSKSKRFPRILRFALNKTIPTQRLLELFSSEPKHIDYLFVTALSGDFEEFLVSLYFRRQKIYILGTVRSWDNLTSHGYFYLEPDLFLSHSPWMSFAAANFQGIAKRKIINWGNPAYSKLSGFDNKNIIAKNKQDVLKVCYASMAGTNRDDINFINWIWLVKKAIPQNIEITVLSHPKFSVNKDLVPRDIEVKCFDFTSSTLQQYYEFLADQHIVLCGGTSVVLDCAYTKTPIVLINFEIQPQPFWFSALRYFDTIVHSKELFSTFNYKYVNSKQQLINVLNKDFIGVTPNDNDEVFIGSYDEDFISRKLLKLISKSYK